jgi:hypothetical protein
MKGSIFIPQRAVPAKFRGYEKLVLKLKSSVSWAMFKV